MKMRRLFAIGALLIGVGLLANAVGAAWLMLGSYRTGVENAVPWPAAGGALVGLVLLLWSLVSLLGRAPEAERRLNLPTLTLAQWVVGAIYIGSAAANSALVDGWLRRRPSQPDTFSGNIHPYWNHRLIYVSQSDLFATHALWVVTFVTLITALVMSADRKWPDPPKP